MSDASARIYDKPGRLQQLTNQFSQELQPFGEKIRLNFKGFFYGKRLDLPLGLRGRFKEVFKTRSS